MRFDWVSKIPFLIKTESEEAQSKNFNTKKKKNKKKEERNKKEEKYQPSQGKCVMSQQQQQ